MNSDFLFLFEDYSLDVARRELRCGTALVPVEPQVFDLLVFLIRNRDRVVSKDDLLAAVWGGRIVSESTLTSRINAARRAVGDSGAHQRMIKTVLRKGIRFVGTVREAQRPAESAPPADAGQPAPQETAEPGPAALGERKQATALAAAISPAAGGPSDPEDLEATLRAVADDVAAIVRRHGGQALRVSAEGVLALFGGSVALEDHAIRACRAAIEIEEDAAGRRERPVRLALALDSSEVVLHADAAGSDAKRGAFGLCLARAQRLAASGQLADTAATPATFALARARVAFAALPAIALEPGAAPLSLHRPERLLARGQQVPERPWKFVGRDAELAVLSTALHEAGAGRGQLVTIVGEAGIGKSRLVQEFCATVVPPAWHRLAAAGDPLFVDSAYLPIAALLRSCFGLAEEADGETVRAHVEGAMRALDPALAPAVVPLLSLLDAAPLDPAWGALEPSQRRRQVIDAVTGLLHRLAQRQPVVVVVEDLHWLDGASRLVIEHLVETLEAARILLLVNYRPEFTHGWASRSVYRQIRIDPLPGPDVRTLLDEALGGDPSVGALKSRLSERAGGNPFFLEECIRAVEVSGLMHGETGMYRFVGEAGSLALPETVHAVIAARLDGLSAADKQLLQIAAVIGTEFSRRLLMQVGGLAAEVFDEAIVRLQAVEFLVPARIVPEPVYRFKHALTHEVVYGSLLKQRRSGLHLRVLDALEGEQRLRTADQIEALAFHASRAEDWPRAARYARQAGMKAAARSANREAARLFAQALAALQRLPDTPDRRAAEIDLHFESRNALFVLGEPEHIMHHLQRAAAIAQSIADPARQSQADLLLSGWYWQNGEHRRALEIAERTMAVAVRQGDDVLQALAHYRRGTNLHAIGSYDAAAADLRRSLALLERVGATGFFALGGYPSVFCCSFLAWSLAELGEMPEARAIGARGWELSRRLNNSYSQTVMSFGFGHALVRGELLDDARRVLEEGLALYRINEVAATYPWIAAALGYVQVRQGEVEPGLALIRHSVAPEVRRSGPLYAHPYLWLAEALVHVDARVEAQAAAETGRAIAEAQEERGHLAWAERLIGDLLASGEPARAAEHYASAIALAGERRMRPLLAQAQTGLSRLDGANRSAPTATTATRSRRRLR